MTIDITVAKGVATVTINRPEKKNAITLSMRKQLWSAFEGFSEDDSVRAVVLTGAGGTFCSGMDVGAMGDNSVAGALFRNGRLHRITRAIHSLKKPVIAAIDGACVGAGWSYALACDFIIASDRARFAQIFRNIGYAPDAGAVWFLQRQIGEMRAREIVYSGRFVDAHEALQLGLALEVLQPEALLPRAIELATTLASGPGLAQAFAKRQFQLAGTMPLDQFLEAESSMQALLSQSDDHKEGVVAFREKRPPQFRGA